MTKHVRIPAYVRWSIVNRYGKVVKITKHRSTKAHGPVECNIAHEKLDKSGKIIRVIYDDYKIV